MKNRDLGLLIIRLSVGLLMLPHGISKLPTALGYGVYLGEILAPLMVALGYRTRLGALVMIGTGLFVLFLAYADSLFSLTPHGGWAPELPGLFLFGALGLFFTGGGKFALSTRSRWD